MNTHIRNPISIAKLEHSAGEVFPLTFGFDQIDDHVVITDIHGNVIYANNAVEHQTGFSKDEIIGRNIGDLWGGRMPAEFYEKMWYAIKIEKKPFVGEVLNIRRDGEERWQELHIFPLCGANGEVKFFVGIEPAITERKTQEHAREEAFVVLHDRLHHSLAALRQALDWLYLQGKFNRKEREKLDAVYMHQQAMAITLAQMPKAVGASAS